MNPVRKFTIICIGYNDLEALKNPKWSIGFNVNFLTG